MSDNVFTVKLRLPAQAAAETEATLVSWKVSPGDRFTKGTVLAEAESAKASFVFDAPCDGVVTTLLCKEGDEVSFEDSVIEIQTADSSVAVTPEDVTSTTTKTNGSKSMDPVIKERLSPFQTNHHQRLILSVLVDTFPKELSKTKRSSMTLMICQKNIYTG